VRSLRVTFGVSRDNDNFEWSSRSLFAQRRNLFSPTFYRMLFDILRFNQFSPLVLSPSYPHKADTISDYLARNQYSSTFANDYLIPLASSLWIHDQDDTLNGIPIVMLVQYLYNHRILDTFGRSLEWLVLEGGAKRYVDAILEGIPAKWLHKSTPVKSLSSTEGVKLSVVLENGKVEIFDRVIMATHAPDALSILGDATPEERAILGKFRTSESTMVLHSDISVRLSPFPPFPSSFPTFVHNLSKTSSSCHATATPGPHGTTTTSPPPLLPHPPPLHHLASP
jgi:predicted NAD/FAD-binding protein